MEARQAKRDDRLLMEKIGIKRKEKKNERQNVLGRATNIHGPNHLDTSSSRLAVKPYLF